MKTIGSLWAILYFPIKVLNGRKVRHLMEILVTGLALFLVPIFSLFISYRLFRRMEMARGPAILVTFLLGLFILIVWVGGLGALVEYLDKTPKE